MKLPTVEQACKALGITALQKDGEYNFTGSRYMGVYGTSPVRIIFGNYVSEDGFFLDMTTIQKPYINIRVDYVLSNSMSAEVTLVKHR